MNLPNKLTLLRLMLVPVFVGCLYIPGDAAPIIGAGVFIAAYITDILDGSIARKTNQITDFGKLMDPMADKLLTSAAFIMLTWMGRISPIAAIIVITREFLISGIRLLAVNAGNVIAASTLGKLKTVSQCAAVVAVLIWPVFHTKFAFDQLLVWISVLITFWSGLDYFLKNKRYIEYK